ncbi:MAG: membrane protein insertion efficiency factor YidD [Bacillota bacterium]
MPDRVALALISFYRQAVSPYLPRSCRYIPTCSAYARTAVERHGWRKGLALAGRRVLRCHPWHPGGPDPVP